MICLIIFLFPFYLERYVYLHLADLVKELRFPFRCEDNRSESYLVL